LPQLNDTGCQIGVISSCFISLLVHLALRFQVFPTSHGSDYPSLSKRWGGGRVAPPQAVNPVCNTQDSEPKEVKHGGQFPSANSAVEMMLPL